MSPQTPKSDYQIRLNFIPVIDTGKEFSVYRTPLASPQELKPDNDVSRYKLPPVIPHDDDTPYCEYWVSFNAKGNYEKFNVGFSANRNLTCQYLFNSLVKTTQTNIDEDKYKITGKGFYRQVTFIQQQHSIGNETIRVQPYYLKQIRQFGFLLEFHFELNEGEKFTREVQKLSLSLNDSYNRNLDYYRDINKKIDQFYKKYHTLFSQLNVSGEFTFITANTLQSKEYIFGGGSISNNQFSGLRKYSPYKSITNSPNLLFIFREQDRQHARLLALGLQREQFSTFPGFKKMFNCGLHLDSNPIIVESWNKENVEKMCDETIRRRESNPHIIPMIILPTKNEDSYYIHKAIFLDKNIPTQVCTLPVLQSANNLKWSISNIALQIFCKAGGAPWKVHSTSQHTTLIVGISQSHKIKKEGEGNVVEKFSAFSVLTDNSGLFQEMRILSQDSNEESYLDRLRTELAGVLSENKDKYDCIVIHTSHKIKFSELVKIKDAINEVARQSNDCQFAIARVNHKNKFFGFNDQENSLVPYEATQVNLGDGEYLIWFEGIPQNTRKASKMFSGPTHVQIVKLNENAKIQDQEIIQDLINLSGANWRGFNAKSMPVSTLYCHLIAKKMRDFNEHDLPLTEIHNLNPWFL